MAQRFYTMAMRKAIEEYNQDPNKFSKKHPRYHLLPKELQEKVLEREEVAEVTYPHRDCEKFIDYWNQLACKTQAAPLCRKFNKGVPNKTFLRGLVFFHYLREGKILNSPRMFTFSNRYINGLNQIFIPTSPIEDAEVFQLIKKVMDICEMSTWVPKSFAAVLYNAFGDTVTRLGSGVSFFLECLGRSADENIFLQKRLDALSDEDQGVLENYLIPLYQNIRKTKEFPDDSEMVDILNGLDVLHRIWDNGLEEHCKNSKVVRKETSTPNFRWFVSMFTEFAEDEQWKDIPMTRLFKPTGGTLSYFIDMITQRL